MKDNLKNDFITLFQLVKRNIKIFFKDKVNVFFSLLAPLIVVFLYVVFLCDVQVDGILGSIPENFNVIRASVKAYVDGWMIAGTLAVASVTVALGANGVMVQDKKRGVYKDFLSSPIKRYVINASYYIYNFIVTFIICFAVLLICLIYLAIVGSFYLNFVDILLVIAILFVSILSSTLITTFIMGFLTSESAFSAVVGIFSAVSGFLTGSYMPLSMFPSSMRTVCAILPATHSGSLFRNVFMLKPLNNLGKTLPNEVINGIEGSFSLKLNMFGSQLNIGISWLYIVISIILFFALNMIFAKKINNVFGTKTHKTKKDVK